MTNEFRSFLGSNFVGVSRLFVLVYTNHGDNVKYLMLENINYQNV